MSSYSPVRQAFKEKEMILEMTSDGPWELSHSFEEDPG
jgi:hypothetical protein